MVNYVHIQSVVLNKLRQCTLSEDEIHAIAQAICAALAEYEQQQKKEKTIG